MRAIKLASEYTPGELTQEYTIAPAIAIIGAVMDGFAGVEYMMVEQHFNQETNAQLAELYAQGWHVFLSDDVYWEWVAVTFET